MKFTAVIFNCFLLCFFQLAAIAQEMEKEVVASTGSYYDGGSVSLEWTLGEVVIETINKGNLQLTQGFHQSGAIAIGIADAYSSAQDRVMVYPNPGKDILYFKLEGKQHLSAAALYDLLGNLVVYRTFSPGLTTGSLSLSEFAGGTYLLKLEFDQGEEITIHKIIKK